MQEIQQITITERPELYWSAHKALYAFDARIRTGNAKNGPGEYLGEAPWTLEVYPTMACNIHCTHCYSQNRNKEYRHIGMADSVMASLHRSIKTMKIRGVQYCGGGEPLLWNRGRISEYIASLNGEITRAAMASNAVFGTALARPEVLRNMIFVETAVFSYDDDTYRLVAGGRGAHAKVEESIRAIRRARDEAGLSTPRLNAKLLINKINYSWLPSMYDWATSLGFDSIHLRLVDNYEASSQVALSLAERAEFKVLLERFARERGLHHWLNNIDFILGAKGVDQAHTRCWTVRMGLNAWVIANGEVYVCGPQWGRREYCIGNLREAALEEIWGGERHRAVIEQLEKEMLSSRCYAVGCRHIKQTIAIGEYMNGRATLPRPSEFEQRHAWFL